MTQDEQQPEPANTHATIDVPLTLAEIRAVLADDEFDEPYEDGYGEPMTTAEVQDAWDSAEVKLRKSASDLS